jgi:hypothetical protein
MLLVLFSQQADTGQGRRDLRILRREKKAVMVQHRKLDTQSVGGLLSPLWEACRLRGHH